jgi:GR25 family glycosyltransferase involved in LPS biosynthesis
MKAFIIVMHESNHSVSLANDCIVAAKQFNIVPEIWPAVNGFHAESKFKDYGITQFLHKKIISNPGVQGCFLSHYQLWNKCVELNETILILEHDGMMIRELPDDVETQFTDVLNLDPYGQSSVDYNTTVEQSIMLPINYFYAPSGKSSAAGDYVGGAYGYCIKPAAAKKLIEFSTNIGVLPADKHIGRNTVDLKSTTVPVVRLHKFYSEHSIAKFSSTRDLGKFVSH